MNRNTYSDSKGNSTKSSAYEFVAIEMTNVEGITRDIRGMVGFLKIHESLFSPTLVCEIGIRDESNFFEEFNISGNETIDIEIETKALDIVQTIKHRFFVTEYNDFLKGSDAQVQVYTLTAVSEFAYIAPLKTVSRAVRGTTTSIIQNLIREDLGQDKIVIHGNPLSSYDGIITIQNPLSAALKILKQSFDSKNTPYLLYQQLNGNVFLSPLSYLTDVDENPIYKTLQYKTEIESNPGTFEEFYERSTTIQNLNSKLSVAPSYQAKQGVYASENRYIDLGTKTYRKHIFNAKEHILAENTISKSLNVNDTQEVSDKRLSETASPFEKIPGAHINYQYVNRFSFDGFESITALAEKNQHLSRSYLTSYDTVTHTFNLLGDPLLNPGRAVELLFPKSTDPQTYKEYTGKSITEEYDKLLSGNYLIFQTIHTFSDNVYQTEIVAKTDSLQSNDNI